MGETNSYGHARHTARWRRDLVSASSGDEIVAMGRARPFKAEVEPKYERSSPVRRRARQSPLQLPRKDLPDDHLRQKLKNSASRRFTHYLRDSVDGCAAVPGNPKNNELATIRIPPNRCSIFLSISQLPRLYALSVARVQAAASDGRARLRPDGPDNGGLSQASADFVILVLGRRRTGKLDLPSASAGTARLDQLRPQSAHAYRHRASLSTRLQLSSRGRHGC